MKTLVLTVSLAVAGIAPAHAQIFRSSVGGGAAVGAVAGSLIGGHNGDRWAQGAVIGAVAGALIGAAVAPEQRVYAPRPVYQSPPPTVYGQQVYGYPTTTVPNVVVVPNAPTIYEQAPAQVVSAPPQVVYVESAPRVVYVPAPAPRVV
ncbi:MAG: glycine zipper domain-containing protein, partial [Opitutaceae bacterium]